MTDDSEEIFRRAADNYPIRYDNPDWDTVLKKLEAGEDETAVAKILPPTNGKKYRWLFLLLLLIPLSVIEYKYNLISGSIGKNKEKESVPAINISSNKNEQSNIDHAVASTTNDQSLSENNKNNAAENVPKYTDQLTTDKAVANHNNTEEPSTDVLLAQSKMSSQHATKQRSTNNKGKRKSKTGDKSNYSKNTSEEINDTHSKISISTKQQKKIAVINGEASGEEPLSKKTIRDESKIEVITSAPGVDELKTDSTNAMAKNADPKPVKEILEKTKEIDSLKTVEKEKKQKGKQKHFYIGLEAGPDLSTIKFQSIDKVGISFGFIAGYRISKRLSIETGFLLDKKLYSSEGEYFSTKNIPVYPNTTIEYVTGECNMFEIPLNLYYSFRQKARSSWFASTGISSYLMNKEVYTFDINYNNTIYPYTADYKSHYNKFAAVINLSAGYVHKIGKFGDLRIEPYMKIPIGKVGTGELPIQSAGLMIGFTRNIF